MNSSLDIVRSNFTEIYHAVRNGPPASLPLVANGSGTRIYDARYSWGRLWTWIYKIGALFSRYDYHLEKLKQALMHTHHLFIAIRPGIEQAVSRYRDFLNKAGKGYAVDEGQYLEARKTISRWNQATHPFIRMLDTSAAVRFKRLLDYALGDASVVPYFFIKDEATLRVCNKIITFEGLIESPLPFPLLKKIIKSKPLNGIENKELVKWIGHINGSGIAPNKLDKSLNALTEVFAKAVDKDAAAHLELTLEEKGCILFAKSDRKHVLWRNALKPGSRVSINGKELRLGREIYPDISGSDLTRAYSIIDNPGEIALIANNKVMLKLRQLKMQKGPFIGIKALQFKDIAQDGSIALTEKLKPFVVSPASVAYGELPLDVKNKVKWLAELLRMMVKENKTPAGLTSSALMFNENGELLTLKPLKSGPFDFNSLEDFALKCSAGNPSIFSILMDESGLAQCPAAKLYDDYVSIALGKESIPVDDLAGIYKISDYKVVDRCIVLSEKLKEIRASLYVKLREHYPDEEPGALTKRIVDAIIACKRSIGTAGTVWPSFESIVLAKCANGGLSASLPHASV